MATLADGTPLPQRSLEVPSWVVDSDIPLLPVTFTDAAMEDLESVFAGDKRFLSSSQKSSKIKRITKSATEAKELIQQVLGFSLAHLLVLYSRYGSVVFVGPSPGHSQQSPGSRRNNVRRSGFNKR